MSKVSVLLLSAIAAFALLAPTQADATRCRDGSYSSSSGPGTCSWHGGIDDGTPSFGGGSSGSGSGNSGIYYDRTPKNFAERNWLPILRFTVIFSAALWIFGTIIEIVLSIIEFVRKRRFLKWFFVLVVLPSLIATGVAVFEGLTTV